MASKKPSLYFVSVLVFMFLLPVSFIIYQWQVLGIPFGWPLIGKWLLFWSVGLRLFTAGLRQVSKPAFTAKEIFHFTTDEAHLVIIELGFANICIGLIGTLSLFVPQWSVPAAIAGGLYFGLAGALHIIKKPVSRNELTALVSDVYIFLLMLLYLVFTL